MPGVAATTLEKAMPVAPVSPSPSAGLRRHRRDLERDAATCPCGGCRRRAGSAAHARRPQAANRHAVSGRLDRAPAQIVAEIAAGVAGGARVDAGASAARSSFAVCGPNGFARRGPRRSIPCVRGCASASAISVVTALRARVSIRRCAVRFGKPEHQQRLRADIFAISWEHAVDGIVGDVKDVARHIRHRRTPDDGAAPTASPGAWVGF